MVSQVIHLSLFVLPITCQLCGLVVGGEDTAGHPPMIRFSLFLVNFQMVLKVQALDDAIQLCLSTWASLL